MDYKTIAAAVAVAVTAIVDDSSSSEEDERSASSAAPKRKLPKSRQYFAQVDLMDDEEFFTHFRLSRGSLLHMHSSHCWFKSMNWWVWNYYEIVPIWVCGCSQEIEGYYEGVKGAVTPPFYSLLLFSLKLLEYLLCNQSRPTNVHYNALFLIDFLSQ